MRTLGLTQNIVGAGFTGTPDRREEVLEIVKSLWFRTRTPAPLLRATPPPSPRPARTVAAIGARPDARQPGAPAPTRAPLPPQTAHRLTSAWPRTVSRSPHYPTTPTQLPPGMWQRCSCRPDWYNASTPG